MPFIFKDKTAEQLNEKEKDVKRDVCPKSRPMDWGTPAILFHPFAKLEKKFFCHLLVCLLFFLTLGSFIELSSTYHTIPH